MKHPTFPAPPAQPQATRLRLSGWSNYLTVGRWAPSLAALLIGLVVSVGHPLGVAASIAIPALAFTREHRRDAASVAAVYYLAALSPLLATADTFFRSEAWVAHLGLADLMLPLWLSASVLLALPYAGLWSSRPVYRAWCAPIAVVLTAVPPIGLIGAASPLAAAGFLFPGTEWAGLLLTLFTVGMLTALPIETVVSVALVTASIHAGDTGPAAPPRGWQTVDTHLGNIADPVQEPARALRDAQHIQQLALHSSGSVIVFPEAVVAEWSRATDDWWLDTFAQLETHDKTLLLGVTVPVRQSRRFDFSAQLAALQGVREASAPPEHPAVARDPTYHNAVLVRGGNSADFHQRVPIPVAMWKPFSRAGVPLNLNGPRTLSIDGHKTAILICYEQLIPWPFLTAMLDRPAVIVAVANHFWVKDTTVPRCQRTYASAWARLFAVPILFASNT